MAFMLTLLNLLKLLAFWYSAQFAIVCWHNVNSAQFAIGNGTKQGGVISPYFVYTIFVVDNIFSWGCMVL